MDEYGQIGPEKGDYERDCRQVAHALRNHGNVFVAFAANGTRMDLTLIHKADLLCLPNGARPAGIGKLGADLPDTSQWVLVVREGYGSYWFDLTAHIAPGYLQGKFERTTDIDAEVLTEFLVCVGVECRAWRPPDRTTMVEQPRPSE